MSDSKEARQMTDEEKIINQMNKIRDSLSELITSEFPLSDSFKAEAEHAIEIIEFFLGDE